MAQLQKVSWRTVGYTTLGSVVAIASVVAIVNSDGVRPTSLTSSPATRWLVDQVNKRLVLVDGLAGRVVAKINTESDANEIAVQGVGGAFLLTPTEASVRTISTAKLQLGTPQTVGVLSEPKAEYRVGDNGLTVISSVSNEASIVAVDDAPRPFEIPKSDESEIAADGSMWLFTRTLAQHVNIDQSVSTVPMSSVTSNTTTVGSHAVMYDAATQTVRWIGGADISLRSIANASEAVLQEPGDDAPCVWLGIDSTLVCVGPTGIDRTLPIEGMNISTTAGDRLAIAGPAAVVVAGDNKVHRIDLQTKRITTEPAPTVRSSPRLAITASGDLVWLDDPTGTRAWVVHRFGINPIDKNQAALEVDAQGQVVKTTGTEVGGQSPGSGDSPGNQPEPDHTDNNGQDDPPHAEDDSVTARAGATVIVPVTANDWDPENDAIAVKSVGDVKAAGHGATDVLNGGSVAYVPDPGYSGSDSFSYTIVDEAGNPATATVSVELFAADSANRPPIARPDFVKTRIGHPVVIDVLKNDIDPERDVLSVPTFRQSGDATITDTTAPSGLAALKYDPPPGAAGIYNFTYQAADPQGGTSAATLVTVEVTSLDAPNDPPIARPDAIRLRAGTSDTLDVKANDSDPDGDDLFITLPDQPLKGVVAKVIGQQLRITMQPGAADLTAIRYDLSDSAGNHTPGRVLVVRIGDTAPNRPPVANPDADRVVIGNTVKIPVTANDIDPDADPIRLLTVDQPAGGLGTTTADGNSVRFTPKMPDITEPTPVSFSYWITDGTTEVKGTVTVTVLVEALPRAPFARDDFADTLSNKPVTIDVLANDSDPSGGTPSLVAAPVCPNGGDATTTDTQRVTFTPPTDGVGTYRCRYKIRNNGGLDAEASIIVTVTRAPPGNHDPVIIASALQTDIPLGDSRVFSANSLATDDDSDSLVFVSVGKPEHGTTTFSQKAGSFTYVAPRSGSADHTPVVDNFDVIISDEHGGNVPGKISIRVLDSSTAAAPPNTHEIQIGAVVNQLTRYDVVSELRDSNLSTSLTLLGASADAPTPDAAVSTNGDIFFITPKASGVLFVTYTVQNTDGLTKSGKIKVTIADPPPANPPPVAVADVLTVANGGVNSVDLLANDLGITDPGDSPTITLVSRPPASFGTVDLINGVLTLTAGPGASGNQVSIRYDLDDGSGQLSRTTITLTILACSESPPQARGAGVHAVPHSDCRRSEPVRHLRQHRAGQRCRRRPDRPHGHLHPT